MNPLALLLALFTLVVSGSAGAVQTCKSKATQQKLAGEALSDIVVSMAGFCAVYYKPSYQSQLILRRRTDTYDHELIARACQAANEKARELGWIA